VLNGLEKVKTSKVGQPEIIISNWLNRDLILKLATFIDKLLFVCFFININTSFDGMGYLQCSKTINHVHFRKVVKNVHCFHIGKLFLFFKEQKTFYIMYIFMSVSCSVFHFFTLWS